VCGGLTAAGWSADMGGIVATGRFSHEPRQTWPGLCMVVPSGAQTTNEAPTNDLVEHRSVNGVFPRLACSPVGRFYAKVAADQALNGAVQIAWQAMFSSFPLLLGLLGIFGFFLRDPVQRQWLTEAIASQFPSQVGELLGFLDETRELRGLLGAASLVGLVWSGYWLFQTMELVFNHFYGAPARRFRQQIVMSLTMMALYAALFSLSTLASVTANMLIGVSERAIRFDLTGFDPLIGWLLALGSSVAMFLALYYVIPNRPLRLVDVWPGALLAGVLFVLLNQAFPLYFSLLGGSYAAYKTLGLFLFLMTWFYCLAVILVLGAELNAFLGGNRGAAEDEVAAIQVLLASAPDHLGTDAAAPNVADAVVHPEQPPHPADQHVPG
jgi:membrane protein